ncbi:MAG: hypothetical protein KC591_04410, partial [Gemmatimonadetes bacterium]|nr:hypothetical protein [Gemmatimonadota bacterium]
TGGALVWMFQGPEDVLSSGEIQDQDGDGTPDLVVESYDAGASGDHLYCLSGAAPGPNAVTIWSVRPLGGPSNSGGYGSDCLEISEDLNRDGKQDVLLGTAWGARTAFALDGTNGATHWSFDTYSDSPPNPAVSGWVYTITSTPDTNGDQVPDVFFGCGSDNNRFYHASGSSGSVLWSLDLGDAIFSSAALGDVTGDGIPDCAAGVGDNADAVWVLRGGPTGVPLVWNHSMPGTVMALARVSDLTGNGTDDLFAGTWTSQVFAFDGATGDTAWVAFLPGSANVMRLATLDDVNGDSIPDVAVGSWATSVFALSGADGSILWASLTGDDNWAVGRVDDVTGDGINDVVAG